MTHTCIEVFVYMKCYIESTLCNKDVFPELEGEFIRGVFVDVINIFTREPATLKSCLALIFTMTFLHFMTQL